MRVPFIDLNRTNGALEADFQEVLRKAVSESAFIGGHFLDEFERRCAEYLGARYAVGTSSGTSALRLALLACGIGPGDEVITTPNTFIATAEAISQAGARPVFVDVDDATGNIDVTGVERAIGRRTKAILPVHLYGNPCDMDSILKIAAGTGLSVVEDACQAHGAEYLVGGQWARAGSLGTAGCFSFYPTKNLGALGEGGMVVTNDQRVAEGVRALRDHGQTDKNVHAVEGSNERLDSIQAGFLNLKLSHLEKWNKERRVLAEKYDKLMLDVPARRCPPGQGSRHVYHLYVIRTEHRDALKQHLGSRGVGTAIHYPTPIHLQEAYRHLGYREGDFPVAERWAREILSLPMFVGLRDEEVEFVVAAVVEFFESL